MLNLHGLVVFPTSSGLNGCCSQSLNLCCCPVRKSNDGVGWVHLDQGNGAVRVCVYYSGRTTIASSSVGRRRLGHCSNLRRLVVVVVVDATGAGHRRRFDVNSRRLVVLPDNSGHRCVRVALFGEFRQEIFSSVVLVAVGDNLSQSVSPRHLFDISYTISAF